MKGLHYHIKKKQILSQIKLGQAHIIIGSHSVFSKNVEYNNLGLVVIDEQHKFGVKARGSLQEKGERVDTLVMSATPIPRTLAIILYVKQWSRHTNHMLFLIFHYHN